jgi:hypothetical protein
VRFKGSNNVVAGIQLGSSVTTPFIESEGAYNNSFTTAAPIDIEPLPAPVATTPPTISGTPTVGTRLGSTRGVWSLSNLAYSYQWLRDGTAIPAAKYTTYVLSSADAGHSISLRVTASRAGYDSGSAVSGAVTVANGNPLTVTSAPAVSGANVCGAWISVSNGTWEPGATSWRYEWLIDGQAVASGNRVQVSSAWVGKRIAARVTALREGWGPGMATTPDAIVQPGVFEGLAAPAVSGTPAVGQWLSASKGTWDPWPASWSFEWLIDGVPAATGDRVQLKSTWLGKRVAARVTVQRSGWTPGVATTTGAVISPGTFTLRSAPTVTGTVVGGSWVTVSNGTWDPGPSSWRYEWLLDGVVVASGNRTQVKLAWKGRKLSARVTVGRDGWTSSSAVTPPVIVG